MDPNGVPPGIQGILGILTILAAIFVFILAIMTALLPLFVYRIRKEVIDINKKITDYIETHG